MAKSKTKTFRFRLWVDIEGKKFFGPGRAELLQLIEKKGSISKAANSMGMSYKKAWAMVDEMNSRGSTPYVIAQKGGQKGGGTELTKAGKDVVKNYQKILWRIHRIVEKEGAFLEII